MRACRGLCAAAVPPVSPQERNSRHAKPGGRRPDRAVELDSPNGVALDLGRSVLDPGLADLRVPARGWRRVFLGDSREVRAALLPGNGARGGRVGHHGVALHDPVPLGPRSLPRVAADVVVGRGTHGVVLLVGSVPIPHRVRRLDLGIAQARRQHGLADPEERGHVALALLDSTSRSPGVPWIAFVLLLFWSMIEATIFTFTLRPTMAELLADLTGYEVNPLFLVVILWFFLFIIIGGSFACIQVLNDAIKTRQVGQIVFMVLVEITVALFEVLFLYRELIDAITPWLAQQGIELGVFGTLTLAFLGWVGVRGMTWFLFGRFGAPALLAILGRQAMEGQGAARAPSPAADQEFWLGPIKALKAEHEWFKKEAWALVELATLPVLQLLAAGFNFGVVVILGRAHFTLPFRSLDQVLASTPFVGGAKAAEGGAS